MKYTLMEFYNDCEQDRTNFYEQRIQINKLTKQEPRTFTTQYKFKLYWMNKLTDNKLTALRLMITSEVQVHQTNDLAVFLKLLTSK